MNKGKFNYAQVEEQSGLHAGEAGLTVNVAGNTHLKGAIVDSQATADKNHFSTGSLSTENIANGMAAALSALGNMQKRKSSTTHSAIGSNIQLTTQQGEIPTTLSRDTATANKRVQKADMEEMKARQEMAQVIGEIANNSITLLVKPKVDEAERQKAEAEAILKADKTNAEALEQKRLANEVIKTYGQGGQIQLAVRAVTGVLQGIATGEASQAVVGGLSPYANYAIKKATTNQITGEVDTQANLMAHALLGAIEAYATGNNVAAGAAGALGGELAAKIITEKLYQTNPENLTESQKQTVSALSQLASGLAGGLISDSTAGGINAAEIGKRAVEDNYLFNIPFTNPSVISDLNNKTIAEQLQKEAEEKAKQEIIDRGIPHYVLIEGTLYKYSGKLAINTRSGDIFYGFGVNPISIPTTGLSVSSQIGWVVNLESKELNNNLKNVINNTLQGSSIGGSVCYGICSSFSRTIQTDKPKNLFGIGVGGGVSIGGDRLYQLDEDK